MYNEQAVVELLDLPLCIGKELISDSVLIPQGITGVQCICGHEVEMGVLLIMLKLRIFPARSGANPKTSDRQVSSSSDDCE